MKGPERIETARLVLRRPRLADAEAIFRRYSSDPDVTRYLGWPRHTDVEHTRAFIQFSDSHWEQWPAGPYLIERREDGTLLGSGGLIFDTPTRAGTGYVLARDAWGHGYATEALAAVVDVARDAGVIRLYAYCHPDHRASAHVLEKCGFEREGIQRRFVEFPNLTPGRLADASCYSRIFE